MAGEVRRDHKALMFILSGVKLKPVAGPKPQKSHLNTSPYSSFFSFGLRKECARQAEV